jgi:hypothetical protein
VLYLLLEFWPAGMRKTAKTEAHELLELLNANGYVIFDTRTVSIQSDNKAPKSLATNFRRPMDIRGIYTA